MNGSPANNTLPDPFWHLPFPPFQPVPPPPDVACAWVMANGVVISVDATFSDWFGHQDKDLPHGTHIGSLVVDNKALSK